MAGCLKIRVSRLATYTQFYPALAVKAINARLQEPIFSESPENLTKFHYLRSSSLVKTKKTDSGEAVGLEFHFSDYR
jgi:hypothetical protein